MPSWIPFVMPVLWESTFVLFMTLMLALWVTLLPSSILSLRSCVSGYTRLVLCPSSMALSVTALEPFDSWIVPLVSCCCACKLLGLLSWLPGCPIVPPSKVLSPLTCSIPDWHTLRLTSLTKASYASTCMVPIWPMNMPNIGLQNPQISVRTAAALTRFGIDCGIALLHSTCVTCSPLVSFTMSVLCLGSSLSMDGLCVLALPLPGSRILQRCPALFNLLLLVSWLPSWMFSLTDRAFFLLIETCVLLRGPLCWPCLFSWNFRQLISVHLQPSHWMDFCSQPFGQSSKPLLLLWILRWRPGAASESGQIVRVLLMFGSPLSVMVVLSMPMPSIPIFYKTFNAWLKTWIWHVSRCSKFQPMSMRQPLPTTWRDGLWQEMTLLTVLPNRPTWWDLKAIGPSGMRTPNNYSCNSFRLTKSGPTLLQSESFGLPQHLRQSLLRSVGHVLSKPAVHNQCHVGKLQMSLSLSVPPSSEVLAPNLPTAWVVGLPGFVHPVNLCSGFHTTSCLLVSTRMRAPFLLPRLMGSGLRKPEMFHISPTMSGLAKGSSTFVWCSSNFWEIARSPSPLPPSGHGQNG